MEQRQAATDSHSKPPDLDCKSACFRPLLSTTTIAIHYYYLFNVPRRVEGWVDLGTAGRVRTACAQVAKA